MKLPFPSQGGALPLSFLASAVGAHPGVQVLGLELNQKLPLDGPKAKDTKKVTSILRHARRYVATVGKCTYLQVLLLQLVDPFRKAVVDFLLACLDPFLHSNFAT